MGLGRVKRRDLVLLLYAEEEGPEIEREREIKIEALKAQLRSSFKFMYLTFHFLTALKRLKMK